MQNYTDLVVTDVDEIGFIMEEDGTSYATIELQSDQGSYRIVLPFDEIPNLADALTQMAQKFPGGALPH